MSTLKLKKSPRFTGIPGQLLLVILDGVGLYRGSADGYDGNAYDLASLLELAAMNHDRRRHKASENGKDADAKYHNDQSHEPAKIGNRYIVAISHCCYRHESEEERLPYAPFRFDKHEPDRTDDDNSQ